MVNEIIEELQDLDREGSAFQRRVRGSGIPLPSREERVPRGTPHRRCKRSVEEFSATCTGLP